MVQALLGVLSDSPLLTSIVDSLVPALADGLNDSWPQVTCPLEPCFGLTYPVH